MWRTVTRLNCNGAVTPRTNHALVPTTNPHSTTMQSGDAPAGNEAGKLVDQGFHHQCFKYESPRPTDRDILASMPGVGILVLANLLGEAGVVIRNRDYVALRCLAWIAPVTKESGKSRRVHRRRAANPRLVDSMYHWARVAAQVDSICRQRYDALRVRGHTHGGALRSVADRLLAVACAMLKTGTMYPRTTAAT
ncbi:MAG: IS110 family transposase [Gammaproteobacteria bacterium]|nr:IS110 family transposase [Gammaproteobacteria bacterium]